MARESCKPEDAAPLDAMADIRERSVATDVGGIASEDADIVEESSLLDEWKVDIDVPSAGAFEGFIGDESTMCHEDGT